MMKKEPSVSVVHCKYVPKRTERPMDPLVGTRVIGQFRPGWELGGSSDLLSLWFDFTEAVGSAEALRTSG